MFNCSKGPFSLLKMHSVGELNFVLQRPNFNLVPCLIFKARGLNYNVMKIKDHNIMAIPDSFALSLVQFISSFLKLIHKYVYLPISFSNRPEKQDKP